MGKQCRCNTDDRKHSIRKGEEITSHLLGKDINHKGSWGSWRWEQQFYYLRDEHEWGRNQTKLLELNKQNQRGFSTLQEQCRREHHCGTAKEQPGHDLNSVGNIMTKKEKKIKKGPSEAG